MISTAITVALASAGWLLVHLVATPALTLSALHQEAHKMRLVVAEFAHDPGHARFRRSGFSLRHLADQLRTSIDAAPAAKAATSDGPLLAGASMVAAAQRALLAAGFNPGPVDGRAGQLTREAVIAWQRAHGLPADGRVTTELLRALGAAAP